VGRTSSLTGFKSKGKGIIGGGQGRTYLGEQLAQKTGGPHGIGRESGQPEEPKEEAS